MAAPVDAGRASTTAGSTASVNKACALPASIAAGDILVLMIRSNGADTHTTPTNWTDLVKNNTADAADDVTSIFWKVADGTEGTSVTVTATTSLKWSAIAHRVTGGSSSAPDISTIAVGTTTTPDPTAVTITNGPKDVLVLAYGSWDGEQTSPPATIPASYGNSVGSDSGTAGLPATNSRCAGASRQLTAVSTENPGSWTLSGAPTGWSAWAIAIQQPPPTFTPATQKYRFYHDGTETGGAAWDAENTNVTVEVGPGYGDQKIQLRYMVQETNGGSGLSTDDYQLQVSVNAGAYGNITGSSTDVKADAGSALTDGGATTNRSTDGLTDGTGSFVAGEQEASNGVAENVQLTASNFTEHLFALVLVAADLNNGDTLDFRVALNGGSPGMTNSVTPRITITKHGDPAITTLRNPARPFSAPIVGALAIPPALGNRPLTAPGMPGPLSGGLQRLNPQWFLRGQTREIVVEAPAAPNPEPVHVYSQAKMRAATW